MIAWGDTYYSIAMNGAGYTFYGPGGLGVINNTALGTISIISNTTVNTVNIDKLTPTGKEDTSAIKTMFSIDGTPISEHGRKLSISVIQLNTVNTRWNNKQGVYFKTAKVRRTYTFNWTFLPGKQVNTVDSGAGRDFIMKIGDNQFAHTLTARNLDTSGLTPNTAETITVLVVSYNESLKRRDLDNDEYYWDCSLVLQEA